MPEPQSDAQFMQSATARLQAAALEESAAETEPAAAEPAAEGSGGGEPANGKSNGKTESKSEKATPARGAGGKFVANGKGGGETAPAAAKTDPHAAKLEQLKALSKELGYTFEDTRVSVGERAEFRQQRQRQLEHARQVEAQANARAQEIIQNANITAAGAIRAQQAWDAGDYEGFAKALGHKDWNDLNTVAINRHLDPNYKKVRELEAWKRDQEEGARRAQEQAQQQAAEQQRTQAIAGYKADLSTQLAKSADPLLAAFHDDPMFIDAVYRVQDAHFDGVNTITPEEAVRVKPRNGGDPLFEEMRRLYSRLEKAFRAGPSEHEPAKAGSVREAQTPEPSKGGSGRGAPAPVRRTNSTSIPQRKATEAAAPVSHKSDKEFMKYATARLIESFGSDDE